MASMWTLNTNEFENLFPNPPEKQDIREEDSSEAQKVLGDFNFFRQLEMPGMYGFESSRPRHHQQKRPYTGTENPDPKKIKTVSSGTRNSSNDATRSVSNHEIRNGSTHDYIKNSSMVTTNGSNSSNGTRYEKKEIDRKTGSGSDHDAANKSEINNGNISLSSSHVSKSTTRSREERKETERKTVNCSNSKSGNRESSLRQESPKNDNHHQNLAHKSGLIIASLEQTKNSFVRGTGNGDSLTSTTPFTGDQYRKNPGNRSRNDVSVFKGRNIEQKPAPKCNRFSSEKRRSHELDAKQRLQSDFKIKETSREERKITNHHPTPRDKHSIDVQVRQVCSNKNNSQSRDRISSRHKHYSAKDDSSKKRHSNSTKNPFSADKESKVEHENRDQDPKHHIRSKVDKTRLSDESQQQETKTSRNVESRHISPSNDQVGPQVSRQSHQSKEEMKS